MPSPAGHWYLQQCEAAFFSPSPGGRGVLHIFQDGCVYTNARREKDS